MSLTIVQAKTKGKNKPQHKIWCMLRWQWHFLFLAALLYRKPNNSLWLLVIRVGRKTEWIKSQCALVYWPTMELDSLLCNYFNVRVIWLLVAIWHLDWEQSLIFFFFALLHTKPNHSSGEASCRKKRGHKPDQKKSWFAIALDEIKN